MAELKTKPTSSGVTEFLDAVADEQKRRDSYELLDMMREVTGAAPEMWGANMIGFGRYHYVYESGREGDWFIVGFSPRKENLTLYILSGSPDNEETLARLGKHKTGKGCLYIRKLADVDRAALKELMERAVAAKADSRTD